MFRSMIDLLEKTVDRGLLLGADYVDVRLESYEGFAIRIRKGVLDTATTSMTEGVGIRVLADGSWGFSFTEKISRDSLYRAVENAVKMAKTSAPARAKPVELADVKTVRDRCIADVKEKPTDVSVEEKIGLAFEVDRFLRAYKGVREDTVHYGDSVFRKIFVSSEGSEITIEGCRVSLAIYAVGGSPTSPSSAHELLGGVGGYELVKGDVSLKAAETVAERVLRLSEAGIPRGGVHTVVLDNELLGLIVHEAFGHTAEADMVISGSILTGKLGETVASELVTIVDDPGPIHANGWTPYDDEGVKARKVVIVDKGVLREYMHNRETAALMNAEPAGNARAQSYGFPPLIRMRNTYMEPGGWRPEEIIEDTREGFYLKGGVGGQADSNGEFMFSVQEAWRIEGGELKEPYRGVTVSGNAVDVLKSIDAVGRDLKISSPGTCGKGQLVPVDGGGPHIRCRLMVGGMR
ncbi:MAG: peptidase [Candidatus Bathyarchaeota archaeon B24]|nr:MAG: peptidase [Candidatus Bathyarchaeota archaeon B24]